MQRVIGVPIGWLYLGIVVAIALAMVAVPFSYAEELVASPEPPVATVNEPESEQPPVAPEPEQPFAEPAPEQPVAPEPEQPPVAPEPEQPVAPEPEQPPVAPEPEQPPAEPEPEVPAPPVLPDPVPTEEPQPVQTQEPQPTEEPTVEVTPTPEPSPTPEPTAEPTPVVTWSQTRPVTCELRDGLAAGLEYNQTRTYHCEVSAQVSSDIAMPGDMEIEWKLDVNFPDSYQLRFPQGSQAQVKEQIPNGNATKYTIAHPWTSGSEQKLAFKLDITRTTCAVGEQVLGIQAWPEIDTRQSDAEITRTGGSAAPATYVAAFLPNLEAPSLTMTPVDFGELEWNGESWGTATGTSTITVTNSDPCATSRAYEVNLQISASDPAMLPVLVAVDPGSSGLIVPEADNAAIAIIPAGFEGSAEIDVQFELTPPDDVFEGDYTFGFEATVTAVP